MNFLPCSPGPRVALAHRVPAAKSSARTQAFRRLLFLALLTAWSPVALRGAEAPVAEEIRETDFPYLIPVSAWAAEGGFRPGDGIVIAQVRGDRPTIEPGGSYLVEGSYTLSSAPTATLALSLTAARPVGPSPWSPRQFRRIERGSGSFALASTMAGPGKYHVSFYLPAPSGRGSSSQGGIYFTAR